MQELYIKKYMNHFKLQKSGNKLLNNSYEHVLTIADNKVYYRVNMTEWKTCKSGDLLVSIINNIPLHA